MVGNTTLVVAFTATLTGPAQASSPQERFVLRHQLKRRQVKSNAGGGGAPRRTLITGYESLAGDERNADSTIQLTERLLQLLCGKA